MDDDDRALGSPADEPRSGSVGRAVANATDIGLAYGLATARAGLRAGLGIGRAGTEVISGLVERSPIGAVAGATADALEPTATRARRERAARTADLRASIEAVVGRVVGEVVQMIDVDGIVQSIDIDRIVQGVDIDRIVKTIDIDDIVGRIDINAIVDEIDIDQIVSTTEIGSLVVQSTGGVATEALDAVRSQGVSLDGVVTRITDRLVRRNEEPRPEAPRLLSPAESTAAEGDDEPSAAEST